MKRLLVAVASLVALASTPAFATTFVVPVSLDGAQAGFPSSLGTGSATVTIDDIAVTLNVSMTYSGLTGTVTNAHIHCCSPPGVNSGVIIPFVPPMATGATSGSFSMLFTPLTAPPQTMTPALIAQVMSGGAYINIHTTFAPGGEIRGQIAAVPEPATAALLSVGLLGMGLRRKTRRA